MEKRLLILFLFLILGSCSNDDDFLQEIFVGKTFNHLFFETEQECMDAQPYSDFILNCHQRLTFISEDEVEIMFTDIIYRLDYWISEDEIKLKSKNDLFYENVLIFEIVSPSTLKFKADQTLWNEQTGKSIWD